jgi:hypothetical protein
LRSASGKETRIASPLADRSTDIMLRVREDASFAVRSLRRAPAFVATARRAARIDPVQALKIE